MKIKEVLPIFIFCMLIMTAYSAHPEGGPTAKYKLQSEDVLIITVYGHTDLETKTRVGHDGHITFPLVGKVPAADLTVQELEANLKKLLEEKYLVSAPVTVFIEQYHPKQVSVVGEVNKPGAFAMPEEKSMTLLDAIAMAEGFTKDALLHKVKVIRTGESGEKETIIINVKDITRKNEDRKNITLQSGDIIIVPESSF